MLKFLFCSISNSGAELFTSSASCGSRRQTLRACTVAGSFVKPRVSSFCKLTNCRSIGSASPVALLSCRGILLVFQSCFGNSVRRAPSSSIFVVAPAASWRLIECAQIRQTHAASPVISSLSSSHSWRSSGKFRPSVRYICTHVRLHYNCCCLSQPSYHTASSRCHHRRKAARARDCSETGLLNPRQRSGLSQLFAPSFLCITRISLHTAWR